MIRFVRSWKFFQALYYFKYTVDDFVGYLNRDVFG